MRDTEGAVIEDIRTTYNQQESLQHLYEELLDAAIYTKLMLQILDANGNQNTL